MAESKLDCIGLPCPQPVLKCKQCIEADRPEHVEVLVDNAPASENVARFLSSQGYTAECAEKDGVFTISGSRAEPVECEACARMTDQEIAAVAPAPKPQQQTGTLVFLSSPTLGSGDDELGGKLMQNFILTLPEMGESLWRIILVNGAVYFAIEGSTVLDTLKSLEENGVSILVCGTCLDFFGLLDQKRVGETTNMLDVVTSLDLADKVVKA